MNEEITAKDIISKKYKQMDVNEFVNKAISLFDVSTDVLIVFDKDKYEGIITERSILRMGIDPQKTKIKSLVIKSPKINESTSINEIARLMIENDIMQIPVFKDEKVIGVVSSTAIVQKLGIPLIGDISANIFMSENLITAEPDDTIGRVITLFREYHISRVPIVENGKLIGLISMHDILKKAIKTKEKILPGFIIDEKTSIFDLPAESFMSAPVETLLKENDISEGIHKMIDLNISSLIVVDKNDYPVGIITKKDILEKLIKQQESSKVHIQIASKVSDLDREIIFEEIMLFVDKYKEMLGEGVIYAYYTQLKERTRNIPLMFCRMKLDFENIRLQVRSEGWGEQQTTKNVLRKAKASILKTKGLRKKMSPKDYIDYSDLDSII
jgi:CBS domain-containing protein